MSPAPEQEARVKIDAMLDQAGWDVQDYSKANIQAKQGVAIRESQLESGHGIADYLLYVDGKAAGAIEAKKEGATLSGVEIQSDKYKPVFPDHFPPGFVRCPFVISLQE